MPRKKNDWSPYSMPAIRNLLWESQMSEWDRFMDLLEAGKRPRGLSDVAIGARLSLYQGAESIRAAEMYWVRPAMAEAAMDASTDIPFFNPAVERPAPHGVMAFERPLPPVEPGSDAQPADHYAPGWAPTAQPVDLITWWSFEGSQVFLMWRRDSKTSHGPFEPSTALVVPETKIVEFDQFAQPGHRALLAMIGSAWVMMQTPTVAERRAVTPSGRPTERGRQDKLPTDVTLVDLRSLRHASTQTSETETGRTYTHRFVVRGHWKQVAHGPGRAERRPAWIASYVKGPPDAPFRHTEKVMVWRR
ncbi:hypothetical protein J2X46_003979 [Nocardioides sp. BE266]|uniref:hypothetical protein n=1 Tax=Nocardioides sp. BE266 TaxID=2817725 RepID=UPI00285625C7|nr:hypothetical protein [Nocardioides sp. BE266]MDR7254977.1 hypothetical protein [Nocardioides sp. BE266]